MWYVYFRRIALTVFGTFIACVIALVLVLWNVLPSNAEAEPVTMELPFLIPGTDLIAEYFISYEGDFFEDGSGEFVIDNAALCVYNRGDCYIDFASIHIETADGPYCFEGTCIPPHAKVVLLEINRRSYPRSSVCHAEGKTIISNKTNQMDVLQIESVDLGKIKVTNQSDMPLQNVRLYYKRYDSQWGIYVGGVTYATPVGDLMAGQSILISPAHYADGYAKVFCATAS